MNQEFFTLNSQDLETLITKSNCACHIINPNKTRILMWKKIENNQTTYYLKIGIQKFSSQEQIDRNGEVYWRYWTYEPKRDEKEGVHSELSQKERIKDDKEEVNTESNPITKYQQENLEKTSAINNHVNNSDSNSS